MLRVYNREGMLQSTSEPVAGMEHSVAWRPAGAGGMIVSTQRFAPQHPGQSASNPSSHALGSPEGLASGREGRHDVVFLERNGLRHGEFEMREWERLGGASRRTNDSPSSLAVEASESERIWGYRVREVSWSADGAVLGVWVEGADGDVCKYRSSCPVHWIFISQLVWRCGFAVQLWTTGNWHW